MGGGGGIAASSLPGHVLERVRRHHPGPGHDGSPHRRPHGPPGPRRVRHGHDPGRRPVRAGRAPGPLPPVGRGGARGHGPVPARGDFLLSSRGCPSPAFYGVVIASEYEQCGVDGTGVRAVTATVPMKPPQFATVKNVNYLPNVLSIMDAEDRGAFASVWVDDQGYVAEGPMVNVAFVTPERELVLPAFDKILSGCTAKRMLALAPRLVDAGLLAGVSTRDITAEDAKRSAEMAFVGSGLPVLPVVEWDGKPIGDGKVGKLMPALSDLLWEDMKSGPDRIPVPYKQ
ncbi:D-amino-acid transaminase chloroplastic [Zea mays]|uniref:D-amino-acid transaminase chloroplastic n=1 Tax=Zea mays TaxID=4577 RepID=A0A1D6MET1_MAIZE|nr:D-amino-acid transaminase chloroplastic [Zea mays]